MKIDQLILAPMEGVMDFVMRQMITETNPGAFDFCVSEFIRVTDRRLPSSVFYRYCPELQTNCRTSSGTPLVVQLLGGNADHLAQNAQLACDLGAKAIDLNFGCPAQTVNRHDGGATLLKYPERLAEIMAKVRRVVPGQISVSAKIRLGFDNPESCLENSQRLADAGASWLTVHCRTKMDSYKPPAFWDWIPRIRKQIKIPIIVNGEIWSTEDLIRCARESEENRFMIGRGILSSPLLGTELRDISANPYNPKEDFQKLTSYFNILTRFSQLSSEYYGTPHKEHAGTSRRLKQWLKFLSLRSRFYELIFQEIKTFEKPSEILATIKNRLEETSYHGTYQTLQEKPLPLL